MGKQRVNVIGLGHIGLLTALMLSAYGADVIGTDYNQKTVEDLQSGTLPFHESGMTDLFYRAQRNQIQFTTKHIRSDFHIIAVETPTDRTTGKADMRKVTSAVEQTLLACIPQSAVDRILSAHTPGPIIVITSTLLPGTMDRYIRPLLKKHNFRDGIDIHLAYAPERALSGSMIGELASNPRTIGVDSQETGERVRQLYASFCRSEITLTDIPLAEISKATEDSYLKLQAIFLDELSDACRVAKVDPKQVIQLVNHYFYSEQRSYIGL